MTELKDDFYIALWKLLESKHIDEISVADIVKASGRSRASFYRNYEDKYELAWKMFCNAVSSLASPILPPAAPYTLKSLIGLFLDAALAHKRELSHAFSSLDPRAPRRLLIDAITLRVKQRLELRRGTEAEAESAHIAHVARIYANSMVVMLADWLSGDVRLSVDEMQKAYCHWFSLLWNTGAETSPARLHQESDASNKPVYDAMFELLADRRIDDVHTSDIIRRSGVSRSVFYKNFEDKYDVINQYVARCAERCFRKPMRNGSRLVLERQALASFLGCLFERRIELRNAFESQDCNSLRPFSIRYFTKLIVEYEKENGIDDAEELENVIRMFAAGTVGHVGFWLLKPQQSIDEVIDTFMMLYSTMLVFGNEDRAIADFASTEEAK